MPESTAESYSLKLIRRHLGAGGRLVLFLDYEGTLVPLATTPEPIWPDGALLALLAELAQTPAIQTVILSGCSLASLELMLPIPGLILAGTYGVEIRQENAVIIRGAWIHQSRPVLAQIKRQWEHLIGDGNAFVLEDKGCGLALHAGRAEPAEAEAVLTAARATANDLIRASRLRLLGGNRILEVVPSTASKRQAVHWFLSKRRLPSTLPVYFGDDDGDDDAFVAVRLWGGVSLGVGAGCALAHAAVRIDSPEAVRLWLGEILAVADE